MSKFLILGKNSLVAASFFNLIKNKEESFLISKAEIDFTDQNTFSNIDFNDTVIIDCVNVNNGNAEEIRECNVTGFKNFCDYLKKTASSFKYIYVSSISVLSGEALKTSAYVQSKKTAEDYLIDSGINSHIFRLSYPIGKRENENRLISRLIKKLKSNEEITINNILINLNDVDDVVKAMYNSLFKAKISFVSNNKYIYLSDAVFFLKEKTGSKSLINVKEVSQQFNPLSDDPYIESADIKNTLLKMI